MQSKKIVFMKHMWLILDYVKVLSVHLITDSLHGTMQVLYFKENQF